MEDRINGFEWYLPLAFKDSVAQCKFEQGDVIYRHKPQGKNWGEEIQHIDFLIQVQSPTRTMNTANEDLNVFDSNWNSKIVFEKHYPNNFSLNKSIETTQGKFFTFLWKNDESIFNDNKHLSPAITSGRFRPVKPQPKKDDLDTIKTTGWINKEFITSMVPIGSSGFAIIVDTVNTLMISKRNAINDILKNDFIYTIKAFNCEQAITLDTKQEKPIVGFVPTLSVELFLFNSQDTNRIKEELKKILFKQKTENGVFRLSNHGLFIEN